MNTKAFFEESLSCNLLTVFLFSLAGIPPFAGFWGKYYLFYAAIQKNLVWLSVIAIVLSVISVYYYLKIIMNVWFYRDESRWIQDQSIIFNIGCTGIMFYCYYCFSIYPQLFFIMFNIIK